VNPKREDALIGATKLATPASTPQRLIHTGNPNASPYSRASTSEAIFVAP
jgi:hypothetical protein